MANEYYGIPKDETGIVLNYLAFGISNGTNTLFADGRAGGKTLTHELGHFLGLSHPWGDDGGACVFNGGKDDGLSDTPHSGSASYDCPVYPYYDDCNFTFPGIMYMNYMEYTDDECRIMFTIQQSAVMRAAIQFGGHSFSLTQHPELSKAPKQYITEGKFVVFPNPCDKAIFINSTAHGNVISSVKVIDMFGGKVFEFVNYNYASYTLDVENYANGLYVLEVGFKDHTTIEKFYVIH